MRLNRFIALLIGAAVLVVTLVAGIITHTWLLDSPVWLSSVSPNHKYTVELTGNKGRGGFFIETVVKYIILKNGELIAKDRVAQSGDAMDISFELAYPEHAWIDGNTLRFWRNPDRPTDNKLDTLLISNHTDKVK